MNPASNQAEQSSLDVDPNLIADKDAILTNPGRRELLIAAGLSIVAAGIASSYSNAKGNDLPLQSGEATDLMDTDKLPLVEKTTQQLAQEIIGYRNQLGLTGLPTELQSGNLQLSARWFFPPRFENKLSDQAQKVWYFLPTYLKNFLGPKQSCLVNGVEEDLIDNGFYFDSRTRVFHMPKGKAELGDFDTIDTFLHECIGHGTDPKLYSGYPPKTAVAVSHGKWRALSRAFSIPNEFLNHKDDEMLPAFHKNLGKYLLEKYKTDGGSEVFNSPYIENIRIVTENFAKKNNIPLSSVHYNKEFCRELGASVYSQIRAGELEIKDPNCSDFIENALDQSFVEIYAEMVRYSLRHKAAINNDKEIIGGVREVFEALGADLKFINIGLNSELYIPPARAPKVVSINPDLSSAGVKTNISISSMEAINSIKTESEDKASYIDDFAAFCDRGVIPERVAEKLSSDDLLSLHNYLYLYSKLVQQYPSLKNDLNQSTDRDFDPLELDIWQIETLENCFNFSFVRTLFDSGVSSISDSATLRERLAIARGILAKSQMII